MTIDPCYHCEVPSMKNPPYGKQTALAIDNFPISGWTVPSEVITCLAMIKQHAAVVNGKLKLIPKSHATAIARAAQSVRERTDDSHFPVDVFQTGSGTSTNMNMNEVLASMASAPSRSVHPNDHVNRCQSSNDVFPTAIHIACALKARNELVPALSSLSSTCTTKARQWKKVVKTARTHMMDAVPMSVGDEFESYAHSIDQSTRRIEEAISVLCRVPLGGTAVGSGMNAHGSFAKRVIKLMAKETDLALKEAENHFSAQSCPLALLTMSSALTEAATAVLKLSNDIRLMSTGPVTGYREYVLPSLQPGSSIMPGKTNPVLCESVAQVHMYVTGAHATVQAGVSHASTFQLNTSLPLLAHSLITSMKLLTNVTAQFDEECVSGLTVNKQVLAANVAKNPMLATALTAEIGYDSAAKIAKEAMEKNEPVLETAKRRTDIPERKLKKLLDPSRMT